MENAIKIAEFNMVSVWKNEEGKFGILDHYNQEAGISFRYGREESAIKTAKAVSDENDMLDPKE